MFLKEQMLDNVLRSNASLQKQFSLSSTKVTRQVEFIVEDIASELKAKDGVLSSYISLAMGESHDTQL